jgi:GDA1/CD39 (nucleoside phosphatase) family
LLRPNPSIDEIELATHDFCALEWDLVKENMIGKDKKHPFTKSSQLHNRCVEALYMATLLEHGFGFDGSHRNITLALEVMGHEVEWTLGFALAEVPLPPTINSIASNAVTPVQVFGSLKSCLQTAITFLFDIRNVLFSYVNSILKRATGESVPLQHQEL